MHMITVFSYTFCRILNVGLMFVKDRLDLETAIGYRTSASAVLIAKDQVAKEQLLPSHELNFTIRFDECDARLGIGMSTELIRDENVDVIIGPTCASTAYIAAVNAVYYNIPLFAWGLSTSYALSDIARYPTIGVLSVTSYSLGVAIHSVLLSFGWKQIAFLYSNEDEIQKCSILKNDIQIRLDACTKSGFTHSNGKIEINVLVKRPPTYERSSVLLYIDAFSDMNEIIIAIVVEIKKMKLEDITQALDGGFKRTFILAAKDAGFLNAEYVYIFADTNAKGFHVPLLGGKDRLVWEDTNTPKDNRDAEAMIAFAQTLFISDNMGSGKVAEDYEAFNKAVISRMKDPPFNCVDDCKGTNYSYAAAYAGQLFDSVYVYARALNSTLRKDATAFRNGTTIIENIVMTFDGMSGVVKMGKDGIRYPFFYFDGVGESGEQVLLGTISVEDRQGLYKPLYTSEKEIWWARGGVRPRDVPLCGYAGDKCPKNFVKENVAAIVVIAVAIALVIFAAIFSTCYVF
uniref:ANF_receptor domain-containing protein n=1 Tax=Angiostrongylus cantonensis TaxID=6313 RepID=A0A158P7L4_ANGCA